MAGSAVTPGRGVLGVCRHSRHGTERAVSTALRRSRRYRSRPLTLRRWRERFARNAEEKEQSPTRGAMAAVELYELLLAAALAAARWLAPGSLVGLLEHLLSDGHRARALLCLSAHVLFRVCSCRHRPTAAGKEHPQDFNFYETSIFPYMVRVLRPPAFACTITHAFIRCHTRSQPTNPCAPRRDRWDRRPWRRKRSSTWSHSSTTRCSLPRVDSAAAPGVSQRPAAPVGALTAGPNQYQLCSS